MRADAQPPSAQPMAAPRLQVAERDSADAVGETRITDVDEDNHSARSDDTVWEEAEGAEEDDQIETTVGQSKQETLFIKLEHFIAQKFGKKGASTRPRVHMDAVAQHQSDEDFWCIIDGKVFDLGPFLRGEAKHPGGRSILTRQLSMGGQDADERFVRWHHPSGNTCRRAPEYFIGDLDGACAPVATKTGCCSIS
mmetsp:Transcript_118087/g.341418  ORF Transcript_118087/g.341418 Transcript_118087/m.341418 type:complete len:195 (+) Transcript_118087:34-618(+)